MSLGTFIESNRSSRYFYRNLILSNDIYFDSFTSFSESRHKSIINITENKERISYYLTEIYHFVENKSFGSLDEEITVVNAALASLTSVVTPTLDNLPYFLESAAYRGLDQFLESHNQHIFINTTVAELLFGLQLDMLDTIKRIGSYVSIIATPDFLLDNELAANNFGILSTKNNTKQGPFEVYTGLGTTENEFATFKSYKGNKYVYSLFFKMY